MMCLTLRMQAPEDAKRAAVKAIDPTIPKMITAKTAVIHGTCMSEFRSFN
jgi:hypothetical protein